MPTDCKSYWEIFAFMPIETAHITLYQRFNPLWCKKTIKSGHTFPDLSHEKNSIMSAISLSQDVRRQQRWSAKDSCGMNKEVLSLAQAWAHNNTLKIQRHFLTICYASSSFIVTSSDLYQESGVSRATGIY